MCDAGPTGIDQEFLTFDGAVRREQRGEVQPDGRSSRPMTPSQSCAWRHRRDRVRVARRDRRVPSASSARRSREQSRRYCGRYAGSAMPTTRLSRLVIVTQLPASWKAYSHCSSEVDNTPDRQLGIKLDRGQRRASYRWERSHQIDDRNCVIDAAACERVRASTSDQRILHDLNACTPPVWAR